MRLSMLKHVMHIASTVLLNRQQSLLIRYRFPCKNKQQLLFTQYKFPSTNSNNYPLPNTDLPFEILRYFTFC